MQGPLVTYLLEPLLRWCLLFFDRLCFRAHHWHGHLTAGTGPVVLVANHFSWWDGLWVMLHLRQSSWQLSVPMLQHQLEKRPFLRWWGALPLHRGRQLPQQIAACVQACSQAHQVLLLFPQGQIASAQTSEFVFEGGLLGKLLYNGATCVFLYQCVEYGHLPRPEAHHFVKFAATVTTAEEAQTQYRLFVAECRQKLAQRMAQNMERL